MTAQPRRAGGITFHHPVAFWTGTAAIALGVALHAPDYIASASVGYRMAGMAMSPMMQLGMFLIVAGMLLATYGLVPLGRVRGHGASGLASVHIHAMEGAPLSPAHRGLVIVLGIALMVDVLKPATLGFVVPGTKVEYGLTTAQVALLPMIALTGTTLGSLVWGVLADRIGRRASILLAALFFVGTSVCGFMPTFGWNLFMCLLMGMSAGGMLPIIYALLTESIPARRRGWLLVLHAGLGTAGGYLLASGLAALLEPTLTWRILWIPGLPTGLLIILLDRWIPESPRFLLEHGRVDEAEAVMERYGVVVEKRPASSQPVSGALSPTIAGGTPIKRGGISQLLRAPYATRTVTLVTYGLSWGLVNWGFITFLPAILQERGVQVGSASKLLFVAQLLAVPTTVLAAYLYDGWSSRKTLILFGLLTIVALVGFALLHPAASGWATLGPLTVLLLVGCSGVIGMLGPYSSEVYPTHIRGTGAGLAAGSTKVAGVVAPPLVASLLAASPGFGLIALVAAAPVALSAGLLAIAGVETRHRGIDEAIPARAMASLGD